MLPAALQVQSRVLPCTAIGDKNQSTRVGGENVRDAVRPSTGIVWAYRPELDSLRAYAVIPVLLSHWLPVWFVAAFNWGVAGVYLFFTISGYVITRILILELDQQPDWAVVVRKFYLRRALRIWPIYYLTCLVTFFVWPRIGRGDAAWHFLFASNLLDGARGTMSYPVHFWSLSVEQQFYLAWPLLAVLLTRRQLLVFCSACLLLAPVCRAVFLFHYQNLPLMLTATPSNLDSIAAGAVLALLERTETSPSHGIDRMCDVSGVVGAITMGCIIVARLSGQPDYGFIGGATAVALIALWLIRRAKDCRLMRPLLFNRGTLFIGTVSYGIYIYHLLVGAALHALEPRGMGPLTFVVVATLLTIAVASASWYGIEKPFLRLKYRLH